MFVGADRDADTSSLHVWVCDGYEDEVIEDRVGPVDPGQWTTWRAGTAASLFTPVAKSLASCRLSATDMPAAWLEKFPTGETIIRRTVELRPLQNEEPDARLLMRRDCEYELFRSVEEVVEMPRIAEGFATIDDFVERALSILQRRKSRSGRSLELHAREILIEEGFTPGVDFSHSPISEADKKPDFLFPCEASYQNAAFPANRLRMLAAKTTMKDRWRQILNEANRVECKHLLTLQEGVSENQFREMQDAKVQLVVPRKLIDKYPKSIQPKLVTLRDFIAELRQLAV